MSQYVCKRKRIETIYTMAQAVLDEHLSFCKAHNYDELLMYYIKTLKNKKMQWFHLTVLCRMETTLQMCVFKTAYPTCCHCPYGSPYSVNVMSAVYPIRRLIAQIRDCLIAEHCTTISQ